MRYITVSQNNQTTTWADGEQNLLIDALIINGQPDDRWSMVIDVQRGKVWRLPEQFRIAVQTIDFDLMQRNLKGASND